MPIGVTCHECGAAFDAPDEGADGLAPCPKCATACVVPVPGALPPLDAEAVEPDPPSAPPPALVAPVRVARNEWARFGRGCRFLKRAAALGYIGTVLGLVLALVQLVSANGAAAGGRATEHWEFVLGLAIAAGLCLAVSAFLGALGRSDLCRVPERSGAGSVLGVGAALAWVRGVLMALAVAFVFGVATERHIPDTLVAAALGCASLGAALGAVVELSAVPALVAVAAAMPSTDLRRAALDTTLTLQVGACVGLLLPLVLVAVGPALSGRPDAKGIDPIVGPVLGAALVFESVYVWALYALYETGETAGAPKGDRPIQ